MSHHFRGLPQLRGTFSFPSLVTALPKGRFELLRLLLIVNSAASSVTARSRVVIQKALSADHEVAVAETARRGHAARLAQGAAAEGVDLVVVLGGDGTLNEAANGLAGTTTALAPLPGGSTNVFARTLGLSDDPIEATGSLLEALAARSIKRVGLGEVNGRYFLFHCGIGFDAAVVEQVEKRGSLKRYAGHPLFMYSAVDTWLRHYDRRNAAFTVIHEEENDKGVGSVDAAFALFLNTNPYTYLGTRPFDVAPEATLDRPLTVVTVPHLKLLPLTRIATAALRDGSTLRKHPSVDYRPDISAVQVRGFRPFPYQVDGDYLGEVTSLKITHHPEVLDLVIPRNAHARLADR